jgi:hypothetical protein
MKKWLFLNRVDVPGDYLVIHKAVEGPLPVLAHAADTPLARRYETTVAAQAAKDFMAFLRFLKHCRFHRR